VAALVGEFPFYPVLDGPGGIVPTLPSLRLSSGAGGNVPFIAGSVLDDGVSFDFCVLPHLITRMIPLGTLFVAASVGTTSVDQIVSQISTSFTPCPVGSSALSDATSALLDLYPDDPALGCPFNTGTDTFGFSSEYKRAAALCAVFFAFVFCRLPPGPSGRCVDPGSTSVLVTDRLCRRDHGLLLHVYRSATPKSSVPWWLVLIRALALFLTK
jgi:hypothetical protein